MELFRIAQQAYSTDLSGQGAFKYGGRWNEKEQYMVYTSGSRSPAMLETLVHLRRTQPPANRVVMILYVPGSLMIDTVHNRQLPDNWQTDQQLTRRLGSDWLLSTNSLLLRVPSAIVRNESNYLLNPLHPDFQQVKLIDIEPFFFDERFFVTDSL